MNRTPEENTSLPSLEHLFESTEQPLPGRTLQRTGLGIPRTVLLAEDDADLREVLSLYLKMCGYLVIACEDAQVASVAFRSGLSIDLLLTDFEMPGASGVELARELTAYRPSIPVIFVSGATLARADHLEMESRGWKFLRKPYGLPVLLSEIQGSLGEIFHAA